MKPTVPALGIGIGVVLACLLGAQRPGYRALSQHERNMFRGWEDAMYGRPSGQQAPRVQFGWDPEQFKGWGETVEGGPSRMAMLPDFLTRRECEALIRLAKEAPTRPSASPHYPQRLTVSYLDRNYNATHVSPEDAALVAEVESRVAHLVGIPYNPTDTRLQLTHQGPDSVAWPNLTSAPAAVHHDFNPMPTRIATVIIYLTDVAAGGETVFPWMGSRSDTLWDLSYERLAARRNSFFLGPFGADSPVARRRSTRREGGIGATTADGSSSSTREAQTALLDPHFDHDGDGNFDPSEFAAWLRLEPPPAPPPPPPPPPSSSSSTPQTRATVTSDAAPLSRELREAFRIDSETYGRSTSPSSGKGGGDGAGDQPRHFTAWTSAERLFALSDLDGDGALQLADLSQLLISPPREVLAYLR